MKKITLFLFAFCFLQLLSAQQAPGRFNYQAAVRNSSGDPLINQLVSLQISITDGSPNGASQYVERHTLSTNAFGLINLQIGAGQFQSGDFNAISWGQTPKWLKIDIDPNGGNNFSPLGATELLSVPYALYAQQSADNSPTNELQTLSLNGTQLSLSNGGGTVNLPVGGGWTESSALSTTDQTKKVGIGVISPNQKLQVHDEGQSFTWLQLSHGGSGGTNGDGAFIGEIVSDLKIENCETGDITLGTCITPNQLVVKNNGNVEIAGQLKIAGGSPGEGKVLTSDATGLASWQNAVGSTYTAGDGISIDSGTISTPWKISDESGFSTVLQTKYPVQASGLLIKQYNNWGASVNLFGLAGTSEAPAPVGLNSTLGNLFFGGSYGSGNTWNGGAWITCATAEDWSAPGSKTTAKLSFFTNEDGFYRLRMLINGNGQVSINSGNVSNLDVINSRFLANHRT
ncbi:MAG: hypothetical protein H7246_09420, partial [Phycisphaerae bacterium]|nr:hypothetical protein [Saprospiraceae bacterium]